MSKEKGKKKYKQKIEEFASEYISESSTDTVSVPDADACKESGP